MITVADVEYKSFDEVSNIPDEGLRDIAVKEWAKYEIDLKKIKPEDKKAEEKPPEKTQDRITKEEADEAQARFDELSAKDESELTEDEKEELTAKKIADKEAADKAARENDTGKTDAEIKTETEEKERLARENDTEKIPTEEEVKAQEERIKIFAQKHSIDIDVAKEKIAKIDNYKGKYKGDLDEITHAALSAQAKYAQINESIRQSQMAQQNPYDWREDHIILSAMKDGKVVGERIEKDAVIEIFRKENADSTANLEDDAVWQMAKLDQYNDFKGQLKDQEIHATNESSKVIDTFIANMPERDKRFLDDFKAGVAGLSPHDVLSSPQALLTTLNLVKGITADSREDVLQKEIEAAEKRGFERGKKQSVILGEETGKPESKGGKSSEGEKELDWKPTPKEKKDAEAYFADHNMPVEEKIAMYKDIALLKRKNKTK